MGWLYRFALNRGLFGGSRFFATIGAVLTLVRLLQRISGTGPKTLYTHEMKPGDVLVVSDIKRPRNKQQ